MKKGIWATILALAVLALGCTKVETLNMRPHSFSEVPHQIIWFQIAGFNEEHVGLLRFDKADSVRPTAFEDIMCVGKMWGYDLFDLRPTAAKGLLAQTLGSKNIQGTCQDFERRPAWSYLAEAGYRTGIVESGATPEESLERAWTCGPLEGDEHHLNASLWRMFPAPNVQANTFHYQVPVQELVPGVYYDKSCGKSGECYSNLPVNTRGMYESLKRGQGRFALIVRDFTYLKALKAGNLARAREVLFDLEKLLASFQAEREKKGKGLVVERASLLSTALAIGPGAEKFCGIFDESDMFYRLFSLPGPNRIKISLP